MKTLFDEVSQRCSRIVTESYSTSFSIGIRCLSKPLRRPIYAIYGFVRLADEIVDTFHDHNKAALLDRFRQDTYLALEEKISLNPILNSFQKTVNAFGIERQVIDQFLASMEMDLDHSRYTQGQLDQYILGSAEVVGLMCLRVFCNGNASEYERLKPFAMKLGAAFQKVNFLRDMKADYAGMGRIYFPGLQPEHFSESAKSSIEADIERDFREAREGIRLLPRQARWGVYVAFMYYVALFNKIKNTPASKVIESRVRVRNRRKIGILALSFINHKMGRI